MAMPGPVKRRKRASLVCNRCKRRKIKCDKKKPCSSCKKVDHPCAYESTWAPELQGPQSLGKQVDSRHYRAASNQNLMETISPEESVPDSVPGNMFPEVLLPFSQSTEEMVLLSKKKYDQLTSSKEHDATRGDFQAVIAPITVGNLGHQAFNANVGLVQTPLHDELTPGNIFYETQGAKQVRFEPHVTKLVKNDFLGVNPFQEYGETFSLLDSFTLTAVENPSQIDHNGAFSWRTLQKKDPWLIQLLQFIGDESFDQAKQSSLNDLSHVDPRAQALKMGSCENANQQKSSSKRFPSMLSSPQSQSESWLQSTDANALGLMLYEDDVEFNIRLIHQLRRMIPKRRTVWLLVRRYFCYLYPFAPYVDEYDFRQVISRIIGDESYEDLEIEISLKSKADIINISVLMVMIRFSYVSLFSNRVSANEVILNSDDPRLEELRFLFKNPVNLHCIEFGHRCLHQMLFQKIINIPLLQLTLFLRTYSYLAPEEGDDCNGSNSQIFNSLLVQIGYILGINRDPSHYPGSLNPRQAQFIRKMWTHLNVSDVFQGYRYGNPLSTNPSLSDTRLPIREENNENIFDKDLDHSVTRVLNFSDILSGGAMRNLIDLTLDVKNQVSLPHYTSLLNQIETSSGSVLGNLRDYLRPLEVQKNSYSYGKLVKCALLLSLNSFFLTNLSHLVAYYRDRQNVSLFSYYYKKMMFFCINEILPVIPAFVTKLEDIFGEGVSIWMNPLIIDALYRVNEVIISSITASSSYILREIQSPDHKTKLAEPEYFTHFQKLCKLVVLLEKLSKICIAAEAIMSNRYYFAWRVFKNHQKLMHALSDANFYRFTNSRPWSTAGPHNLNSLQLQDLIDLLKSNVLFLEKQIAENLKEFCVEHFLTKSSRVEAPSVLRTEPVERDGPLSLLDKSSAASHDSSATLGKKEATPSVSENTAPDIHNMFELDLFMLDDLDVFNNDEVDHLWSNMSNQRMQKQNGIDDLLWQGFDHFN